MARAVGDITLDWGSWTAVTWASNGPDGMATNTISGLSNEIDFGALDNAEDVLVMIDYDLNSAPTAGNYMAILVAANVNANYPARSANWHRVGPAIEVDNTTADQWSNAFSLRQAFGGTLPEKVKFAVENQSGQTTAGSAGQATENLVRYQVVYRNAKLS